MTPDPLQGLKDLHLPPPVPWWPPAWGWWVLLCVALLAALLVWFARHWKRAPRVKKSALAALERLAWAYSREGDGGLLAAELSMLLRRVALARAPRHEVAGLTGEDWLRWLDDHGGGGAFSTGVGRALLTAPYRPGAAVDAPALLDLARRWIGSAP